MWGYNYATECIIFKKKIGSAGFLFFGNGPVRAKRLGTPGVYVYLF